VTLPGYTYPPEIWTAALTGAELVPLDAGSVYPTMISLTTLLLFIQSRGGTSTLPTTDPGIAGQWWNNGGVVCVSLG